MNLLTRDCAFAKDLLLDFLIGTVNQQQTTFRLVLNELLTKTYRRLCWEKYVFRVRGYIMDKYAEHPPEIMQIDVCYDLKRYRANREFNHVSTVFVLTWSHHCKPIMVRLQRPIEIDEKQPITYFAPIFIQDHPQFIKLESTLRSMKLTRAVRAMQGSIVWA